MAEEIPDDRFKSEVMRLLNTVIAKLGNHDKKFESIDQRFESIDQKFESIDQRFDGLEQRFDGLEQKVDKNTDQLKILTGQFTDVVKTVIKDNQRITKLEEKVEDLQSNIH